MITLISGIILAVAGVLYTVLSMAVGKTMIVNINGAVYAFKKKLSAWPIVTGIAIIVLALASLYFTCFDCLNYSR